MSGIGWIRLASLALLAGSIAAAIGSVVSLAPPKASLIALTVTAFSALAWSRDKAERRTRWERGRRTILSLTALVVFVETVHLSGFGLIGALDRLSDGFSALIETPVLWGFLIAAVTWFTIQMTLDDLQDLGEPWDISENGTPSLDRLHFKFMLGALVVVACGGIALAGVPSLSGTNFKPGLIWPVALYFPVALAGLVGARRLALRRSWKRQHVLSDSEFLIGWKKASLVWIAAFWSMLLLIPIGGEAPVAQAVDEVFGGVSNAGQWLADHLVTEAEEPEIAADPAPLNEVIEEVGGNLDVSWWTVVFLSVPAVLLLVGIWMLWRNRNVVLAATGFGWMALLRKIRNFPRSILQGIKAILRDFRTMLQTVQEKTGTLKVLRRSPRQPLDSIRVNNRTRLWEPTGIHARRIVKAYRDFLNRTDLTPSLSQNETPRERLKRISKTLPDVAAPGAGLTHLFEEVRYSAHAIGAVEANQATRHLRMVVDALKTRSRTEQSDSD